MLNYKEINRLVLDNFDGIHYTSTANDSSFEIKLSNGKTITNDDFTNEQITAIKQRVLDLENQATAEAEAKKAAAEAKLAALGLTADDLKALGLGGN